MPRLFDADTSDDGADAEYALVARIADGDTAAFERLVRTVMTPLLNYAFHLLHSREVAEDVVQDVLLWIWTHRTTLAIDGSVRRYLFGMVRHRALDALRHARAEAGWDIRYAREDIVPGMSRPATRPDDQLTDSDVTMALHRAIDELPPRQRQIVLLRLRQFTTGEIAGVLGISVKTVEVQITRAYATLRDKLRPWAD